MFAHHHRETGAQCLGHCHPKVFVVGRENEQIGLTQEPPAFCPRCAALRARFFRDDGGDDAAAGPAPAEHEPAAGDGPSAVAESGAVV